MTDNEIIKALECCRGKGCKHCPFNVNCAVCISNLMDNALDLINRQKAEIERLTSLCASKDVIIDSQEAEIERLNKILEAYSVQYGTVKGGE